jgi:hypothetical protein
MGEKPAQHAVNRRLAERSGVDDVGQPQPFGGVGRERGQHHGCPADILIEAFFRRIRVRHLYVSMRHVLHLTRRNRFAKAEAKPDGAFADHKATAAIRE